MFWRVTLTRDTRSRVPQVLHSLGTITYSSHLEHILTSHTILDNGSPEEVEIRCLSIVAVEEIRRAIAKVASATSTRSGSAEDRASSRPGQVNPAPNAVLLDFMLWDLAKVEEANGRAQLPHHRTRSVFY